MSGVHLIHECWNCGEDCWCDDGDVDPHACTHRCPERKQRIEESNVDDVIDERMEIENPSGFCPECGAPPDVSCSCPCDLCAESGLSYCACDDDDAGYALPDEFDDDDNEHDFTTEEDVVT